ncbi:MAG: SsrA-binding protein SmpB [Deltaproteobacteria bacterium]|jgi:SsrA-binding protein|nr:SsrA-binding protein SmpB [Deltaproteobacteria bacterium]
MSAKNADSVKVICQNKKAHFDYELGERFEAGLVLTGTEVKSLRLGKANLLDAYARFDRGEAYLVGAHISPYDNAYFGNHDPQRRRKLLLKKKEINKLLGKVQERGQSLIPLRLYFKNGLAKAELALARGKKKHDKRQAMKEADSKRDLSRQLKEIRNKG